MSDYITNTFDVTVLFGELDSEPYPSTWSSHGRQMPEYTLVRVDNTSACVAKMQVQVVIPDSDTNTVYTVEGGDRSDSQTGNGGELIISLGEFSAADGDTAPDSVDVTASPAADCNDPEEGGEEEGGGCSTCDRIFDWTGGPLLESFGLVLPLGYATNGMSAGRLRVHEEQWTTNILSPRTLRFHGLETLTQIITNGSGEIRQAVGAQLLADVITDNANKYHIDFYPSNQVGALSNGIHTTTGSPLHTWTIANNDATGNTFEQVNVIETRGASSITNTFAFEDNGTNHVWTMTAGNNLRKQVKTISWPMPQRLEVTGIYDPVTDELLSQTTKEFTYVDHRVLLTGEGRGEGAVQEWTTYRYDTNGLMTNAFNNYHGWTRTEYDSEGRVTARYTGTGDNTYDHHAAHDFDSISQKTAYTYLPQGNDGATNSTFLPRQQYDYYEGNLLRSITYEYLTNKTITVVTPQGGDPLTNIVENYASGVNAGRLKNRTNPDGTMAIYEYGHDSATGGRTNIVSRGAPNAGKTAIIAGAKMITIYGGNGVPLSQTTIDIESGITIAQQTFSNHDELGRAQTLVTLGNYTNTYTYICCGVESVTDRDGLVTTYGYDDLKRVTSVTRQGITQIAELDSADRVLKIIRQGTDSSQITNRITAYDVLGRVTASTNAVGDATLYSYTTEALLDADGLTYYRPVATITRPDGGTVINKWYLDGNIENVTGTGVHGTRYEYGFETVNGDASLWSKEIRLLSSSSDSSEWVKSYVDGLGRGLMSLYADNAASYRYYNNEGQLSKSVDPDGVTTLYQYDAEGILEYAAVDMDQDDTIDFGGTDRITQRRTSVGSASAFAGNALIDETYVWTIDSVNSSNLVSRTEQAVDGSMSVRIAFGLTNTTETVCGTNCTATATRPDGSYTETVMTNGFVAEVTHYDSQDNQLSSVDYKYDEHGRREKAIDARNGATTYTYDDADRVTAVTTPIPGVGIAAQTTTTYYDSMGRGWREVHPDGASVTNEYHLTGQLKKKSGARTYPVEYTYDHAGRMATMETWQDFAGNSGIATTTWNYDTNRGWLLSKQYHDGNGPTYTYHPSGKLKTRVWERGVTTTNSYNKAGQLSSINYSDNTADITYTYDRQGRQTSVAQGSTTTTKTYNNAGQLLTEAYTGGSLDGLTVTNTYDSQLRRSRLETLSPNSQLLTSVTYGYDDASRLETVANGDYSAAYSYLANSPLVQDITYKQNTTMRMTSAKAYDYVNRLTSISHADGAATLASYAYGYNAANQRTNVTHADNSYWTFGYDDLGQVIDGKKRNDGDQLFPGLQYEYDYDDIGNRTQTRSGGDGSGSNLRTNNYSANLLNQYTNRNVGPYLEVHGEAATNATVTVNNQSTDRLGTFYRKELNPDNSAATVLQGITNVAVLKNAGTNNQDIVTIQEGNKLLQRDPENFTYDADGNLTSDGLWTNTWNGENRLIQMESLSGVPDAAKKKLVFTYDHQGRRVSKDSYVWNSGASSYDLSYSRKFVYDGWNLIAELDGNTNLVHGFAWGIDLSGSEQGAGGVGGLLMVETTNAVHLVSHDGNGNVSVLADGSDSNVTARYEYSPFGELIRTSGTMALTNPIRFSSKYQEDESHFNYYGYRYYNPNSGRWINRDPSTETSFQLTVISEASNRRNLWSKFNTLPAYQFAHNRTIDLIDVLGLFEIREMPNGNKAILIDPCEIVIVVDHGTSSGKSYTFLFKNKKSNCSAGFLGCWASETNKRIPPKLRVIGIPGLDDPDWTGSVCPNHKGTEFKDAVEEMKKGAKSLAKSFLKTGCKTVNIITIGVGGEVLSNEEVK